MMLPRLRHPASWLNGRRWEDDFSMSGEPDFPQSPVKQVTAQQYKQRDYVDEDAEAMQRQIELIRRMQNG